MLSMEEVGSLHCKLIAVWANDSRYCHIAYWLTFSLIFLLYLNAQVCWPKHSMAHWENSQCLTWLTHSWLKKRIHIEFYYYYYFIIKYNKLGKKLILSLTDVQTDLFWENFQVSNSATIFSIKRSLKHSPQYLYCLLSLFSDCTVKNEGDLDKWINLFISSNLSSSEYLKSQSNGQWGFTFKNQ